MLKLFIKSSCDLLRIKNLYIDVNVTLSYPS